MKEIKAYIFKTMIDNVRDALVSASVIIAGFSIRYTNGTGLTLS